MATAALKKAEVEVTLTLTGAEARALRALTGTVAGSTDNSPRKHTTAIWHALGNVGIESYTESRLLDKMTVMFKDYPPSVRD